MSGKIDYKQKYEELKSRFISSVDTAWRDGYQHGMVDAQNEQMQQQMQSDVLAQQDMSSQKPDGSISGPSNPETESTPSISQNPNGDELDQHIEKLESMLGKSELISSDLGELKKTLNDIRSLQVSINLTKSMESAKNAKMGRVRPPLTITPKLEANLSQQSKKALSMQEQIVNNIFNKWNKDETKASSDISSILNADNLVKKG